VLKLLFGFPGYLWPWPALYLGIAVLTWRCWTPDLATMRTFSAAWLGKLLVVNGLLVVLVTSVWHLRLYVQRAQGTHYKYSPRWLGTNNPNFLFQNQLYDNVFWTIASAVPVWTAYEAVTLWACANGLVRTVEWSGHPAYCLLILALTPLVHEIHFYLIHRAIHWGPLYRSVHHLHHKNVNPGPWSGLAMHPIEHLLYFSGVLLLWLVPSHPLNVVFYLQYAAFAPSQGHAGFDRVVLNKAHEWILSCDSYYHFLHHKYFEVNYGDPLLAFDKWFGTFHDGSKEAQDQLSERMKRRARNRRLEAPR
jgi:sterol desaturase/sphingolipid hydroxylase (fatty acid hydroxylase superfamily)